MSDDEDMPCAECGHKKRVHDAENGPAKVGACTECYECADFLTKEEKEKLDKEAESIEPRGPDFDFRNVSKTTVFFYQHYGLSGVSYSVCDGAKPGTFLTSETGSNGRIHHILLMLNYCIDKIHAEWKARKIELTYEDELALNDLLNAREHLLKSFKLSDREIEGKTEASQ